MDLFLMKQKWGSNGRTGTTELRGFGPVPLTDDHGNDEGLEGIAAHGESLTELNKEIDSLKSEGFNLSGRRRKERDGWSAILTRKRKDNP